MKLEELVECLRTLSSRVDLGTRLRCKIPHNIPFDTRHSPFIIVGSDEEQPLVMLLVG